MRFSYNLNVFMKSRATWRMKGVSLFAGLLMAVLSTECAVRFLCGIKSFSDIRRNHYAWMEISPRYARFALKPNFHALLRDCGRFVRFDTAPCPNSKIGYRINGNFADSGPVVGIVLGDSLTEGRHVDNTETFTARLCALSGRRFINAGRANPSAGPSQHITYLKASGLLGLKPKVVLLQLHPTDLEEEIRWLARRNARYSQRYSSLSWALFRYSLLAFHLYYVHLPKSYYPDYPSDPQLANKQMLSAIDAFIDLGRRRGFRPLVLVDGVAKLKVAAEYAKKRGVFLDIDIGDGDLEHFRFDGHLNERGHDHVARRVWKRLLSMGWLDS